MIASTFKQYCKHAHQLQIITVSISYIEFVV